MISWIWQTLPLPEVDSEDDDILRAEWARSRARVRHATEEVALVREEMRRVGEFVVWKSMWWELRATLHSTVGLELAEGLKAYAAKQAALQETLSMVFKDLWKTPLSNVEEVLQEMDTSDGTTVNTANNDNEGEDACDSDDEDSDVEMSENDSMM